LGHKRGCATDAIYSPAVLAAWRIFCGLTQHWLGDKFLSNKDFQQFATTAYGRIIRQNGPTPSSLAINSLAVRTTGCIAQSYGELGVAIKPAGGFRAQRERWFSSSTKLQKSECRPRRACASARGGERIIQHGFRKTAVAEP
jgi:hypothetical protein